MLDVEAGPPKLLEGAPVLVFRLDSALRVVEANEAAQRAFGANVIGGCLAEQLAGLPDARELASLRDRRELAYPLTFKTSAGTPETLHFLFFPLTGGTLAVACADFGERPAAYGEPPPVERVPSWIIQQWAQANAELRSLRARNTQLTLERSQYAEAKHKQSLAALNLMEDAIEARERVEQASVALRASEARGRAIFKGAPEGAFIVYPEGPLPEGRAGRLMDLNAITLPRYGYSREEFLQMSPGDLVTPELRAEFAKQLERGKSGVVRFESRHRRKDGSEFPVDMSVCPLVLDEVDCLLCTARDSTERKAAEEALRRSEVRYRSLLEGASDPILIMDQTAKIILVNAAAERLLGYSRLELLGLSLERIIPLRLSKSLVASAALSRSMTAEGKVIRKDGVEIPIELRLSAPMVETGGIVQVWLALRDLSGIRQAEAKFQKLLEAAPDAVVVANGTGDIVLVNTQAEKMFGQPRETLLGHSVALLFPSRFRDEVAGQRAACLEDHQHQSLQMPAELFGLHQDGREFPIEVRHSLLKTEEGMLVFTAIRDVSERKEAEQRSRRLETAAAAAESANKAKSVFISTISHEIRTPMNAILGYSQLLLRDVSVTGEARANLKIISRSGEHLLHMINEILDLAKIEAGRALITPRTFELGGLLRDLEGMFRLRAVAKGVRLELDVAEEPQYLIADEGKIRQVLINLLANAVKFTERGRITLQAGLVSRADGQVWLSATVEDTGCGMTAEEQSNLFQPFVQGNAGRRRSGGSGLGLAISQKVAQLLGGEIALNSTPGQGSRFLFEVPVVRAAERDFRRHRGRSARVIGLSGVAEAPRILIADDRQDNRDWLSGLLTKLGFSVCLADHGEAAVKMAEEWHPHLILMDMHMPVLNGLEAARLIRAKPSGKDSVLIALSADAMDDCRGIVLKNDLNDFILKPCAEEELLEKIRKHLGLVYIYEQRTSSREAEPAQSEVPIALSPARLRELPKELIDRLKHAILYGDKVVLNELIPLTEAGGDSELAVSLQELADDYQYDKLLHLLESAWPS